MSLFPFRKDSDLEQLLGNRISSKSFEHLFSGDAGSYFRSMFSGENPRVEVRDLGDTAKVIVEAPGMSGNRKHRWSMRVLDRHLYLRGQLQQTESVQREGGQYYSERNSEQFTRAIPLPFAVYAKPTSVKYEDGIVTIMLDKKKGKSSNEWIDLDFKR